ncbi:MAG: SDR family oxidoreductase [Clostridia bacterium]|nr:SDR family oxidoreductase [Clostridia bacterium]
MKIPFRVDLSKEVVAITGGGGVLMSAFAEVLAACGAKVAVLDYNEEAAKKVAQDLNEKGYTALAVAVNCLDKQSLIDAERTIESKLGTVTTLINGAGGNNPKCTTDNEVMQKNLDPEVKSFFDLDEGGFRFVFDINILTAVLCSQVFAKGMIENGGGNIINISSMNAFRPLTKIPAYSAAKAGVSNLTQWLAVHFAPCNIRVNAIAPGFFVSNQNRSLLFKDDGTPSDRANKILSHTPMQRFGETEDLIGTLLWLSDGNASGFVTGIVVPVDGGFSSYSGV